LFFGSAHCACARRGGSRKLLFLSQPTFLHSPARACFQATVAQLSGCDRHHMVTTPELFTIWLFTKKFANSWSVGTTGTFTDTHQETGTGTFKTVSFGTAKNGKQPEQPPNEGRKKYACRLTHHHTPWRWKRGTRHTAEQHGWTSQTEGCGCYEPIHTKLLKTHTTEPGIVCGEHICSKIQRHRWKENKPNSNRGWFPLQREGNRIWKMN